MQKILIFLFIFLLSGCSIDGLVVWGELNKVHIVKSTSYVKHYRAYFQRTHLHTISHGKKYLYFYNKRTKDLAILLHPDGKYVLYSFSHPNLTIKIRSNHKHGYYHMLKVLKRKGYRVANPHTLGYTTHIALRKYKKVKTYLVEVKDYRHLQSLYRKAIKSYDATGVKKIRTQLPKVLINTYYQKYKAQATTEEQLKQLEIIASKLKMDSPPAEQEALPQEEEESTAENDREERDKDMYRYYMNDASSYELNNYLSTAEARSILTHNQYTLLKKRNSKLQEQKLLHEGSLEELITAYKKDNNPRYKTKIMQRIKEIQQNK